MLTARLCLLIVCLLMAACAGEERATLPVEQNAPTAAQTTPSRSFEPTPTLAITDIPATTTPQIQAVTAPPAATPLAQFQTNSSPADAYRPDYYLLSSILGDAVRSPEGYYLGSLVGVVITRSDPAGPQIRYALLAASPEVGLPAGENLVFVPWTLMTLKQNASSAQGALLLDAEPGRLAQAPAFAETNLPAANQPGWDAGPLAYWTQQVPKLPVTAPTQTTTAQQPGASTQAVTQTSAPTVTLSPSPAATAGTPELEPTLTAANTLVPRPTSPPDRERSLLVRGKLANLRVNAPNGALVGQAEDFVLQLNSVQAQSGQIAFVLLAYNGRLVPLPLSQTEWRTLAEDGEVGTLRMNSPASALPSAPAFTSLDDFAAAPPGWEQAVAAYWDPF